MNHVSIIAAGMLTGVGSNAPASCAAIRAGINNFSDSRFLDKGGEWVIGSRVTLEQPWRGLPRLVHMVVPAIKECLAHIGNARPEEIALLLCVAEKDRPGRLEGLDEQLFQDVQAELAVQFHPRSGVIARGRVGGAIGLDAARRLMDQEGVALCIIAGVDSYFETATLEVYEEKNRLLTSTNSNGFIPGEGGAAILVSPFSRTVPGLVCLGIGRGVEQATLDSDLPLRADGLVRAIKAAFAEAGRGFEDVDYRLTDANGEQYWFKEAALAETRILRVRKEMFDIWHPADCIGEMGAAAAPSVIAVALAAQEKHYSPGHGVLCHFACDRGERVALMLNNNAVWNT
jgi:3-oxoacyl-[acyl-carrier-protein] synthase I